MPPVRCACCGALPPEDVAVTFPDASGNRKPTKLNKGHQLVTNDFMARAAAGANRLGPFENRHSTNRLCASCMLLGLRCTASTLQKTPEGNSVSWRDLGSHISRHLAAVDLPEWHELFEAREDKRYKHGMPAGTLPPLERPRLLVPKAGVPGPDAGPPAPEDNDSDSDDDEYDANGTLPSAAATSPLTAKGAELLALFARVLPLLAPDTTFYCYLHTAFRHALRLSGHGVGTGSWLFASTHEGRMMKIFWLCAFPKLHRGGLEALIGTMPLQRKGKGARQCDLHDVNLPGVISYSQRKACMPPMDLSMLRVQESRVADIMRNLGGGAGTAPQALTVAIDVADAPQLFTLIPGVGDMDNPNDDGYRLVGCAAGDDGARAVLTISQFLKLIDSKKIDPEKPGGFVATKLAFVVLQDRGRAFPKGQIVAVQPINKETAPLVANLAGLTRELAFAHGGHVLAMAPDGAAVNWKGFDLIAGNEKLSTQLLDSKVGKQALVAADLPFLLVIDVIEHLAKYLCGGQLRGSEDFYLDGQWVNFLSAMFGLRGVLINDNADMRLNVPGELTNVCVVVGTGDLQTSTPIVDYFCGDEARAIAWHKEFCVYVGQVELELKDDQATRPPLKMAKCWALLLDVGHKALSAVLRWGLVLHWSFKGRDIDGKTAIGHEEAELRCRNVKSEFMAAQKDCRERFPKAQDAERPMGGLTRQLEDGVDVSVESVAVLRKLSEKGYGGPGAVHQDTSSIVEYNIGDKRVLDPKLRLQILCQSLTSSAALDALAGRCNTMFTPLSHVARDKSRRPYILEVPTWPERQLLIEKFGDVSIDCLDVRRRKHTWAKPVTAELERVQKLVAQMNNSIIMTRAHGKFRQITGRVGGFSTTSKGRQKNLDAISAAPLSLAIRDFVPTGKGYRIDLKSAMLSSIDPTATASCVLSQLDGDPPKKVRMVLNHHVQAFEIVVLIASLAPVDGKISFDGATEHKWWFSYAHAVGAAFYSEAKKSGKKKPAGETWASIVAIDADGNVVALTVQVAHKDASFIKAITNYPQLCRAVRAAAIVPGEPARASALLLAAAAHAAAPPGVEAAAVEVPNGWNAIPGARVAKLCLPGAKHGTVLPAAAQDFTAAQVQESIAELLQPEEQMCRYFTGFPAGTFLSFAIGNKHVEVEVLTHFPRRDEHATVELFRSEMPVNIPIASLAHSTSRPLPVGLKVLVLDRRSKTEVKYKGKHGGVHEWRYGRLREVGAEATIELDGVASDASGGSILQVPWKYVIGIEGPAEAPAREADVDAAADIDDLVAGLDDGGADRDEAAVLTEEDSAVIAAVVRRSSRNRERSAAAALPEAAAAEAHGGGGGGSSRGGSESRGATNATAGAAKRQKRAEPGAPALAEAAAESSAAAASPAAVPPGRHGGTRSSSAAPQRDASPSPNGTKRSSRGTPKR